MENSEAENKPEEAKIEAKEVIKIAEAQGNQVSGARKSEFPAQEIEKQFLRVPKTRGFSSIKEKPKKNWSELYDKHHKKLLMIPLGLFLAALIVIATFYSANGDIMSKDVTLTGGTSVTIFSDLSITSLQNALQPKFPDVVVREITEPSTGKHLAVIIDTKANLTEIKPALEEIIGFELTTENSNTEFTDTTLSSSFYAELMRALVIAFIFMAIVVFAIFKKPLPSLYMILCVLIDITVPLAAVDILGIRISTAGIAAFLMLIGYSVDTDIVLTTKVLKRKDEGPLNHRIMSAAKTGFMMTGATFTAVFIAYIFVISGVLKQIFLILSIGLATDIIATWLCNASLLKWYCEKRGIK